MIAEANPNELDLTLRLYSAQDLANLMNVSLDFVRKAAQGKFDGCPLRYTHAVGKRRLIDYPTALAFQRWLAERHEPQAI